MTASYEFEVSGRLSAVELARLVGELWVGESVQVLAEHPSAGKMICSLEYHDDVGLESESVRAIAAELARTGDGPLYYYRCFDTIRDACDYPRPITVDDLLTPPFLPAYYDGIQYRYLVTTPPPAVVIARRAVIVSALPSGAEAHGDRSDA